MKLFCLPLLSLLLLLLLLLASGAAADVTHVKVMALGEAGYKAFRIPGLCPYQSMLFTFAEGRKYGCGDWDGEHDLVSKYSSDGGHTWSTLNVLVDASAFFGNGHAIWDPTCVVDEATNTMHVMFGRTKGKHLPRVDMWVMSTTDGTTWTTPRNISAMVAHPAWGVGTPANGHGIQVQGAPHAGRLIVPAYHTDSKTYDHTKEYSHTIISDDGGRTWVASDEYGHWDVEGEVVELFTPDLQLLYNTRSENPGMDCASGVSHCRQQGLSVDGGLTFTNFSNVPALPDPMCKGGIARWAAGRALVFANCATTKDRKHLTARLSFDNGATWPKSVELVSGAAGYSTVGVLEGGGGGDDDDVAVIFHEIDTCELWVSLLPLPA